MLLLIHLVVLIALSAQSTYRTEIILERNEQDTWRVIDPRLVLDQGDRVRFRIRSNSSGYLYVSHRNTSGDYRILFPGDETGSENKIEPDHDYIVPTNGGWFRIAGPPGQEIIYWLVSLNRLTGLEQGTKSPLQFQSSNRVEALSPRCDDSIFRARGDCIDTSAGIKALSHTTRDLVFIRENDVSIVSSSVPLNGPVIYEFRLAHR
jgi:Domain of unknown function (DUF4384)